MEMDIPNHKMEEELMFQDNLQVKKYMQTLMIMFIKKMKMDRENI